MRTKNLIRFEGDERTIREWAAAYGLAEMTLRKRIMRGMDFRAALTTPVAVVKVTGATVVRRKR